MPTAGYSGTPLAMKLGIREGFTITLINQPEYYFSLFTDFPENVKVINKEGVDLIHYFAIEERQLVKDIGLLKSRIQPNGAIWISWPKKASKVMTDITDNAIRRIALKNGLVDIKVCAVDEIWSGLKLVIPLKDRK